MLSTLVYLCIQGVWSLAEKPVVIQLTSEQIDHFEAWVLRLDDHSLLPFDRRGRLTLAIPETGQTFEVLDERKKVRFLGVWEQYEGKRQIQIRVSAESLSVHQVVSAGRHQQQVFRVAAEVDVIRPDENPERLTNQTSDLVSEQAGVLLQKTNLGGGAPIIRGMSGNRILLMVDGFRLNNSVYRLGLNQYLNTVPGGLLEQVEVLSGPSGVQYGSDGLGGTVHLRGLDPAAYEHDELAYNGTLSSADGTWSQQVTGRAMLEPVYVQGHITFNDYADLEAAEPVGEQTATGYTGFDASLSLTWKLDEDRRLRFINTHSEATHVPRTDRILSGRDLLWEYHPQRQRLHGLRYEARLGTRLADHMNLGAGYLRQEEGTRRVSAGSPELLSETSSDVHTFQANGTFTKITHGVQWVYGFDSQWDSVDSSAVERDLVSGGTGQVPGKFPTDAGYESHGVFATADFKLGRGYHLKGGLRQTFVQLEGTLAEPIGLVDEGYSQLTPSLSISKVGLNHFLSFGISQGFRAPNLEDALSLGPSNSGFDAPNPGLQPESLISYELDYRFRRESTLFQASLFTGRYTDLIERVPGTYLGEDAFAGEPVFILDNVGKAHLDGVSLQARQGVGVWGTLSADAAWTYGTQTDRDVPMTRIPPLRGNFSWLYKAAKWRLNTQLSWAARQDRLSPGDISDSRIPVSGTPAYQALHLRGRYEWSKRFTTNLSLENVTDELYKQHGSGIYEPGRRLMLGVNARWQSQ